jgi:hypothetical protein
MRGIELSLQASRVTQASPVVEAAQDKRRGNANHLLNFQWSASEEAERAKFRGRKKKMVIVKKEAIIQANCHFVLCPGEHAQSMFDPDHLVDWQSVEQVILATTEDDQVCPVCMDVPVAPKMTKCGHIFCLSCMLHYLSLGTYSWSRCPLCFEAVYPKALKSVEFCVSAPVKLESQASFVLVTREKGSIACAIMASADVDLQALPESRFRRVTTTADITNIVERELSQLRRAIDAETDLSTKRFMERAVEAVHMRKKEWDETYPQSLKAVPTPASVIPPAELVPREDQAKDLSAMTAEPEPKASFKMSASAASFSFSVSASSFSPGGEVPSPKVEAAAPPARLESRHASVTSVTSEADLPHRRNRAQSGWDEDKYIFFQSLDGACIYMHSFNFRCLQHEFGSEQSFPPRLTGKILFLDAFVQNEDTRGKFRFLSHLPLRTAFSIALVDLKHVLSAATIKAFAPELDDLRRRRNAAKKRAEALEKRRIAANPSPAEDDDPFGLKLNYNAGFDTGFAMKAEEGAFPAFSPDSPATERIAAAQQQAPKGWNAVAEKGFYGASLHEPSVFDLSGGPAPSAPRPVITGSSWGKIAATPSVPAPAPVALQMAVKGKKGKKGKVLLLW